MKIQDVRITPIAIDDAPLLNAVGLHAPYALRIIVEVESTDGTVGISEVPGGEKIRTALVQAAPRLEGHDPLDFNRLNRHVAEALPAETDNRGSNPWDQRLRVHVLSALEVACYDLVGKSLGVRVCDLLGGAVREKVPFSGYLFYKYAGAGGQAGFTCDPNATGWEQYRQSEALTPDQIVDQARGMISNFGFPSLKLKGGALDPETEVDTMLALHATFGNDIPLRFDPNAVWSVPTALKHSQRLKGILEYLEDPVRGQADMAFLRNELGIPFATNMCTTSLEDLPESVRLHSEDVILCDHHFWGGFRPCMELAAFCRAFGRGLSMHSNSHLGVSLMAMVHLAAATPNLTYDLDTHYPWQVDEIVQGGRIQFEEGNVVVPRLPGLGVELDRDMLAILHQRYLDCGLTERDDESELRKLKPDFRAELIRF